MIVMEDNFSTKLEDKTYIALGSFDGLHKGHMKLIKEIKKMAKDNSGKSMVLTFKDHPLNTINKDLAPKILLDNPSKVKILKENGVDLVNFINFDKEYMKLCPEDFIKKMIYYYNAGGFVVGFNYRFGYKNLGDIELLDKMSKKFNFNLKVVSPVKYLNEIISSSKIRHILIEDGNVDKAKKMLGRNYFLKGNIVKGKQLGRKLGYPTVNLNYNTKYVLPRGGVYYTLIEYENKLYKGITNVGYNPTVEDKKLNIETHILDFNKDIYGENIVIYFSKRIRDEKKFSSLEGLKKQLKKDKNFAKRQSM
ncbi:bifunctional riboflavin kinase/FAD synthetase [Clostridium botulinum]|uniref:bifunctional riboflavin kinase/FAD synthetase n=1 Tax=Clostridium botulinum TaxID=1491 RepID=UPI001748C879|nr:bifunctional riboflavin kinase/FAD synthetase [Clostridium botulinum]MBD5642344.1 bifunctional riboflavin kinase/FAD synthetase [Clostridium botulinum]